MKATLAEIVKTEGVIASSSYILSLERRMMIAIVMMVAKTIICSRNSIVPPDGADSAPCLAYGVKGHYLRANLCQLHPLWGNIIPCLNNYNRLEGIKHQLG
jgi:hypothetical protein